MQDDTRNIIQSRWASPVVWIGTLTVVLAQLKVIWDSGANWFTIATAIITVVIAFFMGLNNPENKGGL